MKTVVRERQFPWQYIIPTLTVALFAASPARAQNERTGYVFAGSDGIVTLPSVRISDNTQKITWSPDSRRAITFNVRPLSIDPFTDPTTDCEVSIGRWTRTSHSSDTLWKNRISRQPYLMGEPAWVPGSSTVTQMLFWSEEHTVTDPAGNKALTMQPRQVLLWIDSARSTVREIAMQQGDELAVSPITRNAVLIHHGGFSAEAPSIVAIRPDGSAGHTVPMPEKGQFAQGFWSADGKVLSIVIYAMKPDQKGIQTQTYAFDPQTEQLTKSTKFPPYSGSLPLSKVVLKSTETRIKDGAADAVIHPLWLVANGKSERPESMLAPDADLAVLAPDGMAAAYRSGSSSWVSEFKTLPIAQIKSMLAQAKRATTMSNAKQVALSAIMWAQDHDETMPSGTNIINDLTPYARNSQIFEGLNWTFAGGSLTSIASPAETEVGTLDTEDGQAVMYADGHVKWRNR